MAISASIKERTTVLYPIWADAKTLKSLFGLSHPALKKLADNGEIRRKKMGKSLQAAALYNLADLNNYMEKPDA